jgi:hypothetical protein
MNSQLLPEAQRELVSENMRDAQETLRLEILGLEKTLLECRSNQSKASKNLIRAASGTAISDKLENDLLRQEGEIQAKLKTKWREWRKHHLHLNALQRKDDGPEINRRLGVIELNVRGGDWVLQSTKTSFARLTLREMSFSMELDQRLGVPVLYTFAIDEFGLCPAEPGGDYFNEVLGPRSEPAAKGGVSRSNAKHGKMLSVRGRRLPKFAGEQMVLDLLEFELHPLDVRLPAVVFTCIFLISAVFRVSFSLKRPVHRKTRNLFLQIHSSNTYHLHETLEYFLLFLPFTYSMMPTAQFNSKISMEHLTTAVSTPLTRYGRFLHRSG